MIVTNLMIGLPTMLLCLVVQAAIAFWSVRYYVRQTLAATSPRKFLAGLRTLLVAMLAMVAGNFVQITLWGVLFIWLGEFSELYEAVYHSAVNFASLGYGDIVMSKNWKLLGPLEAVNGEDGVRLALPAGGAAQTHSTSLTLVLGAITWRPR